MKEKILLKDYDILARAGGAATAVVEKLTGITVEDDTLNIEFISTVSNAKISAIGVFTAAEGGITVAPIDNQVNKVADDPSLTVIANGGEGNLTFKATGLPDGLSIEPTNGMIIGTIANSALIGSPFNVTVSVKDAENNTGSTQFLWTVNSLTPGDADGDGIADAADAFAFDASNGANTTFPVHIDFKNSSGVFANGFSGMMLDPAGIDDFKTMQNPTDVVVDAENGNLIIKNIPGGDSYLKTNTQKNAYQFGMKVPAGNFVVHTQLLQPFINTEPVKYRSMGMYIGNGDQDNYIKIVISATPAQEVVIEVLKEVDGVVATTDLQTSINTALKDAQYVDLFLEVDPVNKTATPWLLYKWGACCRYTPNHIYS